MATKRSILVTGATCQQRRRQSPAQLLSRGHSVKALTRKPDSDAARQLKSEGADVVVGDLGDATAILRAAGDVDTMFLMGNSYEAGGGGNPPGHHCRRCGEGRWRGAFDLFVRRGCE